MNSNATDSENDAKSSASKIPLKREQSASFLDSVGRFKKGHFILVIGKQNCAQYFDQLAIVPWTAVFDFDPESRSTGLLSRIEAELKNWRSLHICSIQDICTISEHITNWIFLRGCADRTDTRISTKANEWKKKVDEEIDKKIAQLKEFETGITYFTFVVIWPLDTDTAKCMRFIVDKVCTRMKPFVVIVDTGETKSSQSDQNLEVLNDEPEVTTVQIGLEEMCLDIRSVINPIISKSTVYRLPTKDKTNDPRILEEKVQWLKEDFEILYLDNTTGIDFSDEQLEQEEDTFRKGGNLPWSWWYQVGPGHADVERDVMKSIIDSIKDYLHKSISGIITLLHRPGSGGTTLSQRILWELKEIAPCAQIKHNSMSPLIDLVEKIAFLSDKTGKPVIILLDGEDELRIQSLHRLADRSKLRVIMLYLKRYSGEFDDSKGVFFLHDKISKREATLLKLKLKKGTEKGKRQENLKRLLQDVENGEYRTIFEFGLAAHSYEYEGVRPYVRAHLNLSDSYEELLPWQKSLAYLALAYFYGHTSIPCHFFTKMLQSTEKTRILETKDFPQEMQEFIVQALNESRMYTVRISHYYVAKEILDQVLTKNRSVERSVSPYLCKEAKKMLSIFCPGFIKTAGEVNAGNSSDVISRILINTFIKRENKYILEDETQEQRLKGPNKPLFSHILEDASSTDPFTERFEILQQLVDTFTSEAQYRAHLGRLYMICRPEEKQKAEENLKKAYEMCAPVLEKVKLSPEEVPHTKRQDTRNICHMYGNMLSKRVFKYTGKCSKNGYATDVQKYQFPEIAESLLPDVQLACKLFSQTREVMPPGYEDYLGYVGEIQIRLVFCRFIKLSYGTDLQSFIETNVSAALIDFVLGCCEKLDDLFADFEYVADTESIGFLQDSYVDIMRPASPVHIGDKHMKTSQRTRQSIITTLQAQYNAKNFRELLGKLQQEDEVKFIVEHYEQNFQTNCGTNENLDKDFRNWIDAIRHPLYRERERYSIDKVYDYVKKWYEHVEQQERQWKQSEATFYFFVLSSLLGFGTHEQPGNVELLRQSQRLKRILQDLVKYSNNPNGQLEWLGPAVQTIDRLIPGKHSTDENDMRDLEIRIGTICPPNNKPNYGLISLDLGPKNWESVKVFFVPKRWGMKGQSNKGHRVEFVIGFNKKHGYEAFLIKPIGHVKCITAACGNVETRSCDREVKCPKCLKMTQIGTKDEMSQIN